MTETPNFHLSLAENDQQTFLNWRNKINGQDNSDMMKIDAALKEIQDNNGGTGVQVIEVTLYANAWRDKQQAVTVEGLTDGYDAIATLSEKNSDAAKKAAIDADLNDVSQGNNSIVFEARGTVPAKDIQLKITLVPAGLVDALDNYIGVGATKAADVSFDNSNVDMKAINVQDAIEELFKMIKGTTGGEEMSSINVKFTTTIANANVSAHTYSYRNDNMSGNIIPKNEDTTVEMSCGFFLISVKYGNETDVSEIKLDITNLLGQPLSSQKIFSYEDTKSKGAWAVYTLSRDAENGAIVTIRN